MTSDETADAPEKKSRVELRRTPAEILADSILRQQRIKGRKTYGRGLHHEDDYRWMAEAAQELADAFQYVCAENLRVHNSLLSEMDNVAHALKKAFAGDEHAGSDYADQNDDHDAVRLEKLASLLNETGRMAKEVARLRAELDSLRKATLDTAPFLPPMSEENVQRSFTEHLAQHARMVAEQGADDSHEQHVRAAIDSYGLAPFVTLNPPTTITMDPPPGPPLLCPECLAPVHAIGVP